MSRRKLTMAALVPILALVGCYDATAPASQDALPSEGQAGVIPNQYIVVFNDEVTDPPAAARELAAAHGLELRHTYSHALSGFAAAVPPGRVGALRADPRVRYVAPDRVVEIDQQELPTGIDRIDADLNTSPTAGDPVDVDIAILDTGIDPDHPDLNVVSLVSFAGGKGDDGHGHGTHVAGTVAAKDDGIGVMGVAPGARLWGVKVLRNSGSGTTSDVIAGIDYVAQHAGEIEVANMSLGGSGSDDGDCGRTNGDPEHEAICNATDLGVVFVVSAGNSGNDAANHRPASYDEVITVSALADFDGRPGGLARPTCRSDQDDSFANFSNFGADVDLMAPGVCIESTWKQGGYNTISGTSQAAPHVTGAVALYIAAHGRDANSDGLIDGVDVDYIRSALVGAAIAQMDPCGLSYFDDDDGIAEPIVFANATNVGGDGSCAPAPSAGGDVAIASVSAPASAVPGQLIDVTVTVENVGGVEVTSDIFVTLASDNATPETDDDIPIGTATISGGLAAGGSTDLVFSWNTLDVNAGEHTLTARHGLTDDDPSNDTNTGTVTIGGAALATMHVGNLDRASTNDGGGTWTAWVRITVHEAGEAALQGAVVTGTWDNSGYTPTLAAECTTDASGRCEVSYVGIPNRDGSIVFRVDNVSFEGFAYDVDENHDPDGNTNDAATAIRVFFSNSDDYKK